MNIISMCKFVNAELAYSGPTCMFPSISTQHNWNKKNDSLSIEAC